MAHTNHSGELSQLGVWGPITATLDWCEINYQWSYYIAEIVNSLSNVFSIIISAHAALVSLRERLPMRYIVSYAGCALVAVGSLAFHATLLYQAQLADELPMIGVTSCSIFLLFDTEPGFSLRVRSFMIIAGLIIFDALFAWSYYIYRNPIYHQVVFAVMLVACTMRGYFLLHCSDRSSQIPPKLKAKLRRLMTTGSTMFFSGWVVWNLDNELCEGLTRYKIAIGWPAAFLLEGHAWWHILTALGSYLLVTGMTYLTLSIKDDHKEYKFGYTCGLPYTIRASLPKTQ